MIVGGNGNGNNGGEEGSSSPYVPAWVEMEERERVGRPSPDMHPIALPVGTPREFFFLFLVGFYLS